MRQRQFWMVWNPNGSMPRHQHFSEGDANREAERLAKANRGQTFYVLACIGGKITDAVQDIEILPYDHDIPF